MDVHPPNQPIHTKKDFFLHLFTITIGLFIALMLEAGVEWLHHRHIVREARENIRLEIELNHTTTQHDLNLLQQDIDRTHANIDAIHSLRAHPKKFDGSINFTMDFTSLDSAAWLSARDTGALGFMPYSEVQRDAGLYEQQRLVNEHATEILHRQTLAMAPVFMENDFTDLPPNQIETLLHDTAATLIDLGTLQLIVRRLDSEYAALNKP
jgi:hypothetical protein